MPIHRRHRYILPAVGIYWPLIFWLTHIPVPDLARRSGMSDKTMHVLAYLALTFLVWLAVSPYQKVRWNRPAVWVVLVIIAGYGALDEWMQGLPSINRGADFVDFLANLLGILLALGILSFLRFWPALLTVSAIFIFAVNNLSGILLLLGQYHLNTIFHFTAYAALTLIWIQYDSRRPHSPGGLLSRLRRWIALPAGFLIFIKITGLLFGKRFWWIDAAVGVFAVCAAALSSALVMRRRGRPPTKQ